MSVDDAQTDLPTFVAAQWGVSPHVKAFTTTRLGGVSAQPFNTMNLGLHVGDDVNDVTENRRRLCKTFSLPATPYWLNQTHSATVCSIVNDDDSPSVAQGARSGIDGSWTNRPDHVLAVLTADCLPIVISDSSGSCVSVVHAGWRGLASGIVANALAKFDASARLHAWLGPAIGPQAFEVGEDVRGAFEQRLPVHARAFRKADAPGKYWADLYELARGELRQSREITVTGGQCCTFTQSQLFHSHRRDGIASGRMVTLAWIARSP